jgi:3-oxoacyl-[acyl-carrier-protein] synthase-3
MSRAAVVAGVGRYLPDNIVTNDMLAERLDTSDEWILSRTGITQRHVAPAGTTTGDLAVHAGRDALRSAGLDAVDIVIVATTTPDNVCPSTAPHVAARLGLDEVPAFDVSAVCSGFVYALDVGSSLVECGRYGSALVIGAETFTHLLDPQDRTTAAIFGDGAGAVVLVAGDRTEPGALLASHLGSDGTRRDLIAVAGGGSRERSGTEVLDPYFRMDGQAVFLDAVLRMESAVRSAAAKAGWEVESIDRVVAHQANARIITALGRKLGLPAEALVMNVDIVGNTSAASIPIALHHGNTTGALRRGQRVVLPAFGGGITWGAVALTWPGALS